MRELITSRVSRQSLNSCIFVLTHEAAVTNYISTENSGEFAFKNLPEPLEANLF